MQRLALEEQEEQMRKKKEQLQLEADIATSIAKVNVLRTGSNMQSAASSRSNGMESYLKTKGKNPDALTVDAEPLVPQKHNGNGKGKATAGNTMPQLSKMQLTVKRPEFTHLQTGPSNPLKN